ncbi:nucleotidyltransferase domain-containing protein [Roseicella aquatilis]|uniref:Nucleotidyltransferase domain-containing protein n=1 Tax=Roseicella aquatilis TaxID=2527868 RepID=A0A4R4DY94_9PROT|nr:nucleotidyltransferase domain-containing protein [Roseicella aquatilis]
MERPLTEYRFLHHLAELPFVQAVWLFGSRACGTARERSDIDLAILCPGATAPRRHGAGLGPGGGDRRGGGHAALDRRGAVRHPAGG